MTGRRIGILGGTFDPIHCGHLDVGRAAERALGLTQIVLMTANIPPHRPQPVASSYHRFAMVALAIGGHARWRASDLELGIGMPSFTTGTLQHFHDRGFAPTELCFVIGADAFAEIESWKDFPAILDRAHFAVVSRPGFPVAEMPARLPELARRMTAPSEAATGTTASIFLIDAPTANVSATAIRQRAANGEPIVGLVPPAVGQHIERHALYALAELGSDTRRPPAAGRLHGQD
jgi:nicotinate-nucleotide adenylyltransferase